MTFEQTFHRALIGFLARQAIEADAITYFEEVAGDSGWTTTIYYHEPGEIFNDLFVYQGHVADLVKELTLDEELVGPRD